MSVDYVMVPCPKCCVNQSFPSITGECRQTTFGICDAPEDVMVGINRMAPRQCTNCGVRYWVKRFPDKYRPMEWTPTCELEQKRERL